jgi:hypothetical protein
VGVFSFYLPNNLAPCHPPGPLSLQFFDTTPPSTDPHLPFSGSLFFRDLLTSVCSVCSVVARLRWLLPRDSRGSTVAMANIPD